MTWSPEAVAIVIDALNELGSPYFVTGSIASNAYGEPRGTLDADFVLEVRGNEIQRLRLALDVQFESEDQLAFETVTGKVQHKFRHRTTKFLVEIFEARFDDPHERSRFERRKPEVIFDRNTYFPTAEDVIVGKLRWFKQIRREKDRDDIVKVLAHQWQSLDWEYIERWCGEHGSSEFLILLKSEAQLRIASTAKFRS